MLRAAAKGVLLAAFGHLPGGPALYRRITRDLLGTQATHVDKLARVWPIYTQVWRERCGLELAGLRVWVHEAGWTPYCGLINFLLTGSGGVLTNRVGRMLDRYLARAVNGALATDLPAGLVPVARRQRIEPLRWLHGAREALAAVGAELHEGVSPARVPLPAASVDLVHSGGALEHYPPALLEAFLGECHRVLRPGGVASHVLDHRDHLHHADRAWPFLGHLALPGPLYRAACGHPLGYHNRLAPAQVQRCFARAGLEPLALRRLILPRQRYVDAAGDLAQGRPGLPRWLLNGAHRDLSDDDLRTAAAHYIYRRPG